MRTIAHLSDLHFGRLNEPVVKPLKDALKAIQPDLIVVSGDLTQRAREIEFVAARAFLESLAIPSLVVPGNHDIPFYRVLERLLTPYHLYKKYIHADLEPVYEDGECAIAGVNTARRSSFQNGQINVVQLAKLAAFFKKQPDHVLKILVAHHPFDLPPGSGKPLVGHAKRAVRVLLECGVDLFLGGHAHRYHVSDTSRRYPSEGQPALILQSGTAVSKRLRAEVNSFNVIVAQGREMDIACYVYDEKERVFKIAARASRDQPFFKAV